MNLTTFRSRITSELGLDNTNAGTEQGLVDGWVNEGVLQFLLETGCKVTTATMDLTANDEDYALPTASILQVKSIIVTTQAGNKIPLEAVDNDLIDWLRISSVGGTDPIYYALSGTDLLRVFPKPTSADTLTVRYVPVPATLSSGSDTPSEIPAQYHPAVEAYAKWKAAVWDDDASSMFGSSYQGEWEMWLSKARKNLNKQRGPWGPVRPRRQRRNFPIQRGVDYGSMY